MFTRRIVIGGALAAAAGSSGPLRRAAAATSQALPPSGGVLTPEMFGARGDGVTNDTVAFAALSDRVNAEGGGTIRLRRTTYIVGMQDRALDSAAGWAFGPRPLLEFKNCTKAVIVEGNGATIKCAPGLRFGTFDRVTGEPTRHRQPYYDLKDLASPYLYMIGALGCGGPVIISDLELDGNHPNLRMGGPYGDTGWQVPASGIFLRDNRGDEIIRNVHSHHHGQDGLMIDGPDDAALARTVKRRIENVRCEYNARQGCSMIGGRGYAFVGCKFNHTGKAGLASAPAAGFDIEAEGGKGCVDFTFTDCEFVNNHGCGLLGYAGDGATLTNCTLIGTTNWSAWPAIPNVRFHGCSFVGTAVNCYGNVDPSRAVQFHDCLFRDDPALSPTGQVYLPDKPHGKIVDVSSGLNALFSRCRFRLTHNGLLPWSWHAIYSNCVMEQKAGTVAYPKGKYLGFNTITGNVDLYGTNVIGVVIVNGKKYEKVQLGGESW